MPKVPFKDLVRCKSNPAYTEVSITSAHLTHAPTCGKVPEGLICGTVSSEQL